jgi:ABC-type multidrug transport system permease subunit
LIIQVHLLPCFLMFVLYHQTVQRVEWTLVCVCVCVCVCLCGLVSFTNMWRELGMRKGD